MKIKIFNCELTYIIQLTEVSAPGAQVCSEVASKLPPLDCN